MNSIFENENIPEPEGFNKRLFIFLAIPVSLLVIFLAFTGEKGAEGIVGLLALLFTIFISLFLYFLPAVVAGYTHHPNAAAILVLNLFLGWTLIGWVVALVWSFAEGSEQKAVVNTSAKAVGTAICPNCSLVNSAESQFCSRCGNKFNF